MLRAPLLPDGRAEGSGTSGARIYLHLPTRRHYLAEVVAPQAQCLRHQFGADQIHLRSGWLGGPHLDLRAEAGSGGPIDWTGVAAALADGARRYPATELGEVAYLRQADQLGRIESVPPPYLPLHAHGEAVEIGPDRAPHRAPGLARMLLPLLETAADAGEGVLRARVAEAFLTLADCHPHGLRFGTYSFRSHAEAFLHWAGPAAHYRASFTTRLQKDRAALEELVRRVRDGAESAPARAWRQAFGDCVASFTGRVSEDELDSIAEDPSIRRVEGRSPFHVTVAASGVIDHPPPWFAAYRLTINLFYQLLPALDVSPVQRFYLCYAVAEAVDGVSRETWQDRLVAMQAHLAAAR